jgi:hypothetical protein
MKLAWIVAASVALFGAAPAMAQTAPVTGEVATTVEPAAPATIRIPAGTLLQFEFAELLSSRTSTVGQTFALRLAEPIVIDGQTIVEAGAIGGGEVIDAARSGMGGRQGKLIVSGRYVELQGQRARIRGLQGVLAGEDNSREAVNTMMLVPYVGFLGGFIQGGEIEIAAGTRAEARLAVDVVLTLPQPTPENMAPTASEAQAEPSTEGETQ